MARKPTLSRQVKQPEMIKIPAGELVMGSTERQIRQLIKENFDVDKRLWKREGPQHKVFLDEYWIGKYPVTNREFERFVGETGYVTTAEKLGTGYVFDPKFKEVKKANWSHPMGPKSNLKGKKDHPVVQVSWFDANEYCRWLSEKTGRNYRLPTEAEWEKAARGTEGRVYPWGNEWREDGCNYGYKEKGTTSVGKYSPEGDSVYGCGDMAGNVFEWTSTTIGTKEPWPAKYKYPYVKDDGREDMNTEARRVGRGGSYSRSEVYCRGAFRFADMPADRYSAQGFRVAR